jgi:ADP-dependent NAD(P)H-hydrate dehydratase / NAD(P)H-hydrate epimerase
MQNLLTSAQMKAVDAHTIEQQPIDSVNLMEKAAAAFVAVFMERFPAKETIIWVVCGQGNNGGDGLAIARLLHNTGYSNINVFLANFGANPSPDYLQNLERLPASIPVLEDLKQLEIPKGAIIIDAILGFGLNKPLTGKYVKLTVLINNAKAKVVAVDVPTGFKSEGEMEEVYNGVRGDLVIAFQRPKINFFFPESVEALKEFAVAPIGLDENYLENMPSPWKLVTPDFVQKIWKPRQPFSHKGTYGHALVLAGAAETMGAALLTTSACLQAGAGLVTACIPQSGLTALNVRLPEAMYLSREQLSNTNLAKYNAIAVGPGLGTGLSERQIIQQLLQQNQPLVLDADALNIIAANQEMLWEIPAQSIITPHLKEFDRLFGDHQNWWQRVQKASAKAQQLQIVIILKNQYTFVCLPTGEVCINPTGNAAMAQGGMGDVLTGIVASFLAQGYTSREAVILSVYLHGATGDFLAETRAVVSASALAEHLSVIMKQV